MRWLNLFSLFHRLQSKTTKMTIIELQLAIKINTELIQSIEMDKNGT